MADEKIFTIPLRDAFGPGRPKRAKTATTLVRDFLIRHMKSENVKIGKSINENVWARGIQHAPRRLRVHAIVEDGTVYAELVGVDIKKPILGEAKKREAKEEAKEAKIKEERKERKKLTVQEKLDSEDGKQPASVSIEEGATVAKEEVREEKQERKGEASKRAADSKKEQA